MSWSDDTRCLYCEGRLPLYRKISHGQFCSSAHRKAYWQEQERLAVERLHQSHDTLRAYRSIAQEESSLRPERELAPSPSLTIPKLDLKPVVDDTPVTVPDMSGLLAEDFLPSGGNSPDLVAADPFEYEIAPAPLPPVGVWEVLEVHGLPEGTPVAAWAYGAPHFSNAPASIREGLDAAEQEFSPALCQPRSPSPTNGMRAAGRIDIPLAAGREAWLAAPIEADLRALEIALAPARDLRFEVRPQSDVLVELLDQQVPHPEQLQALVPFAAHQSAFKLLHSHQSEIEIPLPAVLPEPAMLAAIPDYQLSATGLHQLTESVLPAQGKSAGFTAISEIPVNARGPVYTLAMPAAAEADYHVGTAGLESLDSIRIHAAQGVFAHSGSSSMALDLTSSVSSDIALPSVSIGASRAAAPRITEVLLPLTFGKKRKLGVDVSRFEPMARVIPQAAESHPILPSSGLEPLDRKPAEDALRPQGIGSLGERFGSLQPVWAHATGFWQQAPRDLKLLLFAIPALLALVFHPGLPRIAFAAPKSSSNGNSGFMRAVNDQWVNVRQTLENRAAIALDEDFRSGLDNWASPGGSTTEWSFDSTGFVRPGPLALYRPSVSLADYQVQFMGLIDKQALSWVVRAADFENFYVVKLVVLKSGPLPAIGLTRYAVIGGKAQDRHDVAIPLSARGDTLYRVRMDVQGSNYSLEVQGQMADSWTETRLPRGGVGFFSARGEQSRLRWLQITHQYDMLGRLCAYLAPFDTTNGSWQP